MAKDKPLIPQNYRIIAPVMDNDIFNSKRYDIDIIQKDGYKKVILELKYDDKPIKGTLGQDIEKVVGN